MTEPKLIYQAKKDDCFNACLAMMLGLELNDIPEFSPSDYFYNEARGWLHSMGWELFYQDTEKHWEGWKKWFHADQYTIGQEHWENGNRHAFIMKGSERFFDPTNENNDGKGELVGIYFLIPLKPFIKTTH
jgi:hypothetical protein